MLSGIVYGHPKIEDGRRISTSMVKDFEAENDGTLYLVTQNSRYKHGKELAVENIQNCFGKETMYTSNV